ncbi:MAG: tetratricopeptide repeat protein [Gemmatimonadetes bacterium]|nr:tetratricopeptide repeat protein [Gemmatimonadota bacterium]
MRSLAALVLVALCASSTRAQAPAALPPAGAITIGLSDSVQSTILKEKRKLLVWTPPSYRDTTYPPRAYPVLYLLDGDAHFHSVTGLIQFLSTGINGTFVVPEMIVVAIPNTNRMRDMSPTNVKAGPDGRAMPGLEVTGGMGNFLSFIKNELIPHVDSAYRTSGYRIFVGHSLGGITVVNALYTMPETFSAYLAIDPSLWWDSNLLLKQARAQASQPGHWAGKALYLAQANTLNPADTSVNQHFNAIAQFDAVIKAYNRAGLRYGFRYYPEDSHGSVPLMAEYDGLRFLFKGYALDLAQAMDRPAFIPEHYAAVSSALGTPFEAPEQMIDMLGAAVAQGDRAKAFQFFKLNAELHTESAHAHLSLGMAYLAQGDTAKAIAELERALAIAPGRTVVRTMLAGLRKKG